MSYSRATQSVAAAEALAEEKRAFGRRARALGHLEADSGMPAQARGAEIAAATGLSCARIPIRDGFSTQSQSGALVAPLMGEFRAKPDGGVTGLMCWPMNWVRMLETFSRVRGVSLNKHCNCRSPCATTTAICFESRRSGLERPKLK